MITVNTTYNKAKRHIHFEVKGHAGQAERGHDIVCSAVSILVYTVAHIFMTMEIEGDFSEIPCIELQSGDTVIDAICKDDNAFGEAVRAIFYASTGCRLLQATYPQYVQLFINEA